ncbi:MAG: hypothetical protein R3F44_18545 [Candidatus Competibacteraceae bacterium]
MLDTSGLANPGVEQRAIMLQLVRGIDALDHLDYAASVIAVRNQASSRRPYYGLVSGLICLRIGTSAFFSPARVDKKRHPPKDFPQAMLFRRPKKAAASGRFNLQTAKTISVNHP